MLNDFSCAQKEYRVSAYGRTWTKNKVEPMASIRVVGFLFLSEFTLNFSHSICNLWVDVKGKLKELWFIDTSTLIVEIYKTYNTPDYHGITYTYSTPLTSSIYVCISWHEMYHINLPWIIDVIIIIINWNNFTESIKGSLRIQPSVY